MNCLAVLTVLCFSLTLLTASPANTNNDDKVYAGCGHKCTGKNEAWLPYGTFKYCEPTCGSLHEECTIQYVRCPDGCQCIDGYARDPDTKECVDITTCIDY